MQLTEYNEIEGVGKLKIDASAAKKTEKTLFQRYLGTIFIDTSLAAKELAKKPRYRKLAEQLRSPLESTTQGRKLFREVAMYYNIHEGIGRIVFHYKEGSTMFFYFFSASKLIELEIGDFEKYPAEIGRTLGVRFAEAGRNTPAAYAAMIGGGAADVMSKVVKSLMFHKSATGAQYSYAFVGAKGQNDTNEEGSKRSRLYLTLIRAFSRQLKMYLYVLKEIVGRMEDVHYVLSFKKMKEFERMQGVTFKSYSSSRGESD